MTILECKLKFEEQLLQIKGVEGVGIGEEKGQEHLLIYVSAPSTELTEFITKNFRQYPVKVEVTGNFTTQN